MIRKERKGPGGVSNISRSIKEKVKPVNPDNPGWMQFMSMPKLKQTKNFGQPAQQTPDNIFQTKASYKSLHKKIKRVEDAAQPFDPVANLHNPLKWKLGTSPLSHDYDPDDFVREALERSRNSDEIQKSLWTLKDCAIETQADSRTATKPGGNLDNATEPKPAEDNAMKLVKLLQEKAEARGDKKELLRVFDREGKKSINENNIKEVFDSVGFSNYSQQDLQKVMAMANTQPSGPLNSSDMFKLISNTSADKMFANAKDLTQVKSAVQESLQKKKKDNVLAILTNDIKRVHKAITDNTDQGFIAPEKLKSILTDSVKKWDLADVKVVDELVQEKTQKLGVDSQEILEIIANSNLKMKFEKDDIRRQHAELEHRSPPVFENRVHDTTVKRNGQLLDEISIRRNPVQVKLSTKFKDRSSLMNKLVELAGDSSARQISKADIFELYKQAIGKEHLEIEDKQRVFKFADGLKFRNDDKKVDIADVADLVFGNVVTNTRLKEIERFPLPPPPELKGELEMIGSTHRTEQLSDLHRGLNGGAGLMPKGRIIDNRTEGDYSQLNRNPQSRLSASLQQPLNFSVARSSLQGNELKQLADKLGFTLSSKRNNNYQAFKFLDADNDG